MSDSFTVPGHFNGPLESGNGGYSAGALAAFLDGVHFAAYMHHSRAAAAGGPRPLHQPHRRAGPGGRC